MTCRTDTGQTNLEESLDCTHDRRPIKILTVIDEFSRQRLSIVVDRKIRNDDDLCCLADLFLIYGIPDVHPVYLLISKVAFFLKANPARAYIIVQAAK